MLNSARKKLEEAINHNYPHDNSVFWKSKNGNYNYMIINLGTLPSQPILKYTQLPGLYPIPDNYEIETSWGRSKKNYVQASINYIEKVPHFKIEWTYNEQTYVIVSPISPSDASNKYCNIQYSGKKTAFSGILIFGLQLYEELNNAIPKKNLHNVNKIKRMAKNLIDNFEAKKNKVWHPADNPKLKEIVIEAGEQPWLIKFEKDEQLEQKKAQKIVQIMDESNISRRGYRSLTATSKDLPKEWLVSEKKHNIDEIMQMHIPLLVFDMKSQISNSDSDSDSDSDSNNEENVITLEKGGYRSISKILQFLMPKLVASQILNYETPKIYLRVSGDGRNVGKKKNHVMVTLAILNDKKNIMKPEKHYTISLFSGKESYTSLKIALEPIRNELQELYKKWASMHLMHLTFARALEECKNNGHFVDEMRELICEEMNTIGVKFEFWEDYETKVWKYKSLMGPDKLKVIENFNLNIMLPPVRATKVQKLWLGFCELYKMLGQDKLTGNLFRNKAQEWLDMFLTPSQVIPGTNTIIKGLYTPSDITPYMHVLINHVPEFIDIHSQWGLGAFSCQPVEKKNHQHVSTFFAKTLKDGGEKNFQKSAIMEILKMENRALYFWRFDDTLTLPKYKKINIVNSDKV
ncbi:35873_t:CDS:2 [Gigaspora margarita]|uniref:35873_t:CDS:1 n=1 Tax=Gigaspora margarita TaxID=4874 RepID=A0ABN7VNC8_GIGMA|nr:35873_t:CDS:2 [Gigaspora margarita]